jgi:hypothetical protein
MEGIKTMAAKIKGGLAAAAAMAVVIVWLMTTHAIDMLMAWHAAPLHQ